MTTPNAVPTGNTYDKYASTNPIERRMMDGFFGALDACIEGLAPSQVIEVGTGEGEVLERLITAFPQAAVCGNRIEGADAGDSNTSTIRPDAAC